MERKLCLLTCKTINQCQRRSKGQPKIRKGVGNCWLVSPAYLKSCISCVLSQFHPKHQSLIYSSELITLFYQKNFTMSENVPPQQQFYPNHHVIQHPMVGVSQVINNETLIFFSCKLPATTKSSSSKLSPSCSASINCNMCKNSSKSESLSIFKLQVQPLYY